MNTAALIFDREVATADTSVTRSAVHAFAESVDDECAQRSGELLAPPMFAVVPALPRLVDAKRTVTSLHTLHGEHDLLFHEPIRIGSTISTSASLVGVYPTSAGTAIVTRARLSDGSGHSVGEQHMVSLLRGTTLETVGGARAPAHPPSTEFSGRAPDSEVTVPLAPDQGRKYGLASGDEAPYTYDRDAARVLGYDHPILHGMCTLAMACRHLIAFVCPGEPWRLRRLAARFCGLLYVVPGQVIRVRLWRAEGTIETAAGFEVYDGSGVRVISNGWAEAST